MEQGHCRPSQSYRAYLLHYLPHNPHLLQQRRHLPPQVAESISQARGASHCWHSRQHLTRQNNALVTFCHEVADYFVFAELLFIVGTARRQKANGVGNVELLQSYTRLFRYTRPGKSYIIETPALRSFL